MRRAHTASQSTACLRVYGSQVNIYTIRIYRMLCLLLYACQQAIPPTCVCACVCRAVLCQCYVNVFYFLLRTIQANSIITHLMVGALRPLVIIHINTKYTRTYLLLLAIRVVAIVVFLYIKNTHRASSGRGGKGHAIFVHIPRNAISPWCVHVSHGIHA